MQPLPRFALVDHTKDKRSSAITRVWNQGETSRCRLCPLGRCSAVVDGPAEVCQVLVEMFVEDSEAPLFSSVGLAWERVGIRGDH